MGLVRGESESSVAALQPLCARLPRAGWPFQPQALRTTRATPRREARACVCVHMHRSRSEMHAEAVLVEARKKPQDSFEDSPKKRDISNFNTHAGTNADPPPPPPPPRRRRRARLEHCSLKRVSRTSRGSRWSSCAWAPAS